MITLPRFKSISVLKGIFSISQNEVNASSFAFKTRIYLNQVVQGVAAHEVFQKTSRGL